MYVLTEIMIFSEQTIKEYAEKYPESKVALQD